MFVLFIAVLFTLGLFYRWEHRVMIADLRRALPALQADRTLTAAHDWRIVSQGAGTWVLRRSFHVPDKTAAGRYAAPVLLAAVMMIGLGNIPLGLGYAAFCIIKWFAVDTELQASPLHAYSVKLAGIKMFGEPL